MTSLQTANLIRLSGVRNSYFLPLTLQSLFGRHLVIRQATNPALTSTLVSLVKGRAVAEKLLLLALKS